MPLIDIPKDARKGLPPCGECHVSEGETCDICGASQPSRAEVAQMDAVDRLGIAIGRIAALRDVLEEIDGELDRQLYDDDGVKSCRDAGLDVPGDAEHHVVVTEALRCRIRQAVELARR